MKAQHKILACLFSLLLLGSCTSDWLEPEQPSKLDPNNAYSTYTGCMGVADSTVYTASVQTVACASFTQTL